MDSGAGWPTQVDVTLSPGRYIYTYANGSFSSSASARICGRYSFAPGGFDFGFPLDTGEQAIQDVTFSADVLDPGTTTSAFHIDVTISEEASGGIRESSTVLDTIVGHSGASGTAQLSVVDGQRMLTVDAADEDGVSVHLVATCSRS
jgi:hypothetical protein